MAARITCPRVLATEQRNEVVVDTRSLKTRFVEFWQYCWGLLWGAIGGMCVGLGYAVVIVFATLAIGCAILAVIAFFTCAWFLIWSITTSCHKSPGVALDTLNIRDITAVQSSESWQVKSAFNATFSTWNRNTVTKCFTTYRHIDVRVEYRGQIVLRQQVPLRFSLKPYARRPFSVDVKSDDAAQLKKELGPVMQAEMRNGNITLKFFYDIRYLIADRRSKWERNGCVVVFNSPLDSSALKTMVAKKCYTF